MLGVHVSDSKSGGSLIFQHSGGTASELQAESCLLLPRDWRSPEGEKEPHLI